MPIFAASRDGRTCHPVSRLRACRSLTFVAATLLLAAIVSDSVTAFLPVAARVGFRAASDGAGLGMSGRNMAMLSPAQHHGSHSRTLIERHAEGNAADDGVRVGVMTVPGQNAEFRAAFEKLNVTNATFFQTEVPDAFQLPLAAKFLAMSQTVDVIVVAHGELEASMKPELLRAYQTVAITTNVAVVPFDASADVARTADVAKQMGEIRQQALLAGGARKSTFFGIGKNDTNSPTKKEKVYF